jgi:hypothetical protein
MHPKKKIPTQRRNTRRAIQAHQPLQPADPDKLEDPSVLPMSPMGSDQDASSVEPPATAAPKKKDTFYIASSLKVGNL